MSRCDPARSGMGYFVVIQPGTTERPKDSLIILDYLPAELRFQYRRYRDANMLNSCLRPFTPNPRYKRYRLSDGKDFSSLFFPEKEALLRVLEHFEKKSGKQPRPLALCPARVVYSMSSWP